jgi:hypothetical protein
MKYLREIFIGILWTTFIALFYIAQHTVGDLRKECDLAGKTVHLSDRKMTYDSISRVVEFFDKGDSIRFTEDGKCTLYFDEGIWFTQLYDDLTFKEIRICSLKGEYKKSGNRVLIREEKEFPYWSRVKNPHKGKYSYDCDANKLYKHE